jgi:hypothetical protein
MAKDKEKKEPEITETPKPKKAKCDNCDDSGRQCSVCTPIFVDTFGTK